MTILADFTLGIGLIAFVLGVGDWLGGEFFQNSQTNVSGNG